MKKMIGCLAVLIFMAPVAFAAVIEDWSNVNAGKDTGTFEDTMGSKIAFVSGPGPDGAKALKITSTMIQGGYCGIWHNFSADLSKSDSVKFKVKTSAPGDVEMAFKDTYNVQYITRFAVSSPDWTEVTVPFSSFNKDPYYTPPEAVLGHPMDLSKATGMNFAPKIIGDSVVEIGPVSGAGTASAPASPAAPAAAAPAAAAPTGFSLPEVPDIIDLPPALTGTQPSAAPAAAAAAPAAASPPAAAPAASASSSTGAVVEDWSNVNAGKDTGTFEDTMGSKIAFVTGPGPDGAKALKITSTMIQGGYCGIWHNFSADLSKSDSVKFKVKTSAPGDVEMAFKDTYNVQYITRFAVSSPDWTEVTVPFSSFNKDPYYTPPEAVLGHPMDMSKATGMNFAPKIIGDSVVEIGPVSGAGTASAPASPAAPAAAAPAAAAPAAKPVAPSGTAVPVLIYDQLDTKSAGGFQDSQGSAFKFEVLDNKGKKYMKISYTLVKGGWSGMWCRAGGIDWSGADLSGATNIVIKVYTPKPIVIGLALKDANKNQYIADTPLTKAGVWQAVSVPLSSFVLDPYYTPPDAIKGAPKDFSSVGTFNIQPKSEGAYTFGVDTIVAK